MEEGKNLKKKNLWTVAAVMITLGTVNYFMNKHKKDPYSNLTAMSEEINKTSPMKIDNDTRIDSAAVVKDPLTLVYYSTIITLNKDSLAISTNDLKKLLQDRAQATLDNSKGMSYFREANVAMHYFYKDKTGRYITDYTIKPTKKQT